MEMLRAVPSPDWSMYGGRVTPSDLRMIVLGDLDEIGVTGVTIQWSFYRFGYPMMYLSKHTENVILQPGTLSIAFTGASSFFPRSLPHIHLSGPYWGTPPNATGGVVTFGVWVGESTQKPVDCSQKPRANLPELRPRG